MRGIDSVLVVVDRGSNVLGATQKACVIARHFAARLEFFACDNEYACLAAQDAAEAHRRMESCMADSRRFLDSVRSAIAADDLSIEVSVACSNPMPEAILRKVRDSRPDLVVRALARSEDRHRASILHAFEWQIARTCPAPLLFTRGIPWRPAPRIGIYLPEAGGGEAPRDPGLRDAVIAHSERLAAGCHGEAWRLGDATATSWQRESDVVVLPAPLEHGAQSDRHAIEALIEKMECDFLLVPAQQHPLQ